MQVAIELPEDVGKELCAKWKDLPRYALEAVAIEGYRSGALTESQVRRMLGFDTRMEANAFLKDHGVYYSYSPAEIQQEIEASERLLNRSTRQSPRR
jgi:vacuolar-type H+-ATPase subunit C/Vma6